MGNSTDSPYQNPVKIYVSFIKTRVLKIIQCNDFSPSAICKLQKSLAIIVIAIRASGG